MARVHTPLRLRRVWIDHPHITPDQFVDELNVLCTAMRQDEYDWLHSPQWAALVHTHVQPGVQLPTGSPNKVGRALGIEPFTQPSWAAYNWAEMLRTNLVTQLPGAIVRQRIRTIADQYPDWSARLIVQRWADVFPGASPVFLPQVYRVLRTYRGRPPRPVGQLPLWVTDGHFVSRPVVDGPWIGYMMPVPSVGRVSVRFRAPWEDREDGRGQRWAGKLTRPTVRPAQDGGCWFDVVAQRSAVPVVWSNRWVGVMFDATYGVGVQAGVWDEDTRCWRFPVESRWMPSRLQARWARAVAGGRPGLVREVSARIARWLVGYAAGFDANVLVGQLRWVPGSWGVSQLVIERMVDAGVRQGVGVRFVGWPAGVGTGPLGLAGVRVLLSGVDGQGGGGVEDEHQPTIDPTR